MRQRPMEALWGVRTGAREGTLCAQGLGTGVWSVARSSTAKETRLWLRGRPVLTSSRSEAAVGSLGRVRGIFAFTHVI